MFRDMISYRNESAHNVSRHRHTLSLDRSVPQKSTARQANLSEHFQKNVLPWKAHAEFEKHPRTF